MTFEQLYTTYFPDVYRFAVWLTRDTTQAEDVASETFVRAWGRRELADRSPDPQRRAAARSDLDRVTSALTRMLTVDRMALVLRTEQSLPYEEIARVLEISGGAARVKVHRARRRLLAETMTHNGGE